MFDDIARVTEKIIMELNEKDNEKFAIDFAQKLTDAGIKVTKIYGPSVEPVNVSRTEFRGVQLNFSEHDKKVYRETEKRLDEVRAENHALQKQVEELKEQNTDIQKCHMKLQNDGADEIRELKAEIEKLKKICQEKQYTITDKSEQINELYKKYEPMEDSIERFGIKFSTIDGIPMFSFKLRGKEVNPAVIIAENDELKAEIQRLREKCGEVPIDTDKTCVSDCGIDYEKLFFKLQEQHNHDCITINQLHVTIDNLVDRYANLRKNVGID